MPVMEYDVWAKNSMGDTAAFMRMIEIYNTRAPTVR
jgi:hypothetical protein